MEYNVSRSAEATWLIDLYNSFRIAEFVDQSADCPDINVRVMRMLCYFFRRDGRTESIYHNCVCDDIAKLEELADEGDYVAQANLGQCYLHGLLVDRNETKALEWFEKSAASGYQRGKASLGRLLSKSETKTVHKRGLRLLKEVADQGCAPAMVNLGALLLVSSKSIRQLNKAKRLILKGADAGVYAGYNILCSSFFVDEEETSRIVRRAWERDFDVEDVGPHKFSWGSPYNIDRFYDRCFLACLQIDRLKDMARRDAVVKTYLAYLYMSGRQGVLRDEKNAVRLFRQAAEQGVAAAQCLLGECLYRGKGCRKDVEGAFKWFSLAAGQNEFQALGWLGNMYYKGEGCKRDLKKSVDYQIRAVKLGNEGAQYNLALHYLKRVPGLYYAPKKAVDLLWPIACHGRAKAIAVLGECYLYGEGVQKDVDRAFGLLAVAKEFENLDYITGCAKVRQNIGYLKFYHAALSNEDKNIVDASIFRMLESYKPMV